MLTLWLHRCRSMRSRVLFCLSFAAPSWHLHDLFIRNKMINYYRARINHLAIIRVWQSRNILYSIPLIAHDACFILYCNEISWKLRFAWQIKIAAKVIQCANKSVLLTNNTRMHFVQQFHSHLTFREATK